MEPHVEAIAREFRDRLEAMLGQRLIEVKVFGSQARGEQNEESDLDIFVLLDRMDRPTRWAVYDVATDLNLENDFREHLAPLVMGRAEFERLLQRERRLAREIQAEGVSL